MTKTLIKTDKNGTKYYEEDVCPKCGGTGYLPFYHHVDCGRCFKCDGTGLFTHIIKEYTPEHAKHLAELAEKRAARKEAAKKAKEEARLQKWRDEHPEEVKAYNERKARRKQLAAEREMSNYVGKVGSREQFEISVDGVTSFETEDRFSYYGGTIQMWVYIMRDALKNVLVWITSNNPEYTGLKVGTKVKVKATVKDHDDSRGYRQTILSRLRVCEA